MTTRWFVLVATGGTTIALGETESARALAQHSRPAHAAFEAAATVIALLGAYLVTGRFLRVPSPRHLALACGLGTLAATNFAFGAVPAMQTTARGGDPFLWGAVLGGLAGQVLVAYASQAGDAPLARPKRSAWLLAGIVVGALVSLSVGIALLGRHLPAVARAGSGTTLSISVHPLVTVAELTGAALFACAAIGFDRQARQAADPFLRWLAFATALAAIARASYALEPTLYTQHVYVGDVLRAGYYCVLLIAAFIEIRTQWARAAVAEERRRLARDLHDGLAQELAFITTQSRRLLESDQTPQVARLASAAERALGESRRAIASLSHPSDEPLAATIGGAAAEAGHRAGVTVRLEPDDGDIVVAGPVREALVRVVQEAVGNAGRHGAASVVDLRLTSGDGLCLVVTDDGGGFDPTQVHDDGVHFGLTSMRERIEGVGGHLEITSAPGMGTRIEAHVP